MTTRNQSYEYTAQRLAERAAKQAKADKLADRAGDIKAQMSDLQKELDAIRDYYDRELISEGNGERHRATFSISERIGAKWKACALSMNPSPQRLKAYETVTEVKTLRVNARIL
jgi:hypothetical protein